ncbi:unnamed protein product [Lampetra fluviatilis]
MQVAHLGRGDARSSRFFFCTDSTACISSAKMSELHAATLKLLSTFNELARDNAVKDCLKKEKFRSFLKGDEGKSLIQIPLAY